MRSGVPIFVYKPRIQDTVSEADMAGLHDAMRTHGPNTLLAVTIAETPDQVGAVRMVRPGLLRGYVDRFAPGDAANAYSADAWDAVCGRALRMVDAPAWPSANETGPLGGLRRLGRRFGF